MPNPVTQAEMVLLVRAGLRKNFRDRFNRGAIEFEQYLRTDTTSSPEVHATVFTGPSRLFEMGDIEAPIFDAPRIGPKVTGVDREFGLGVGIGRKLQEDDLYGKSKESGIWLANAAKQTDEYRSAQLLDDIFAGSDFLGIDGKALVANDHPFLNETGTWSNLAAAVGLSLAGLTNLRDLAMNQKDHNGDPVVVNLDRLIIGNDARVEQRALQILRSTHEPFTADNQENALKMKLGISEPTISRYKLSKKSYMMVDSEMNDAWFLRRRAHTSKTWIDDLTGAILSKIDTRFIIWFVDARGWYGANPT